VAVSVKPLPAAKDEVIEDDRDLLVAGDNRLLIIEDDPNYARVLLGMAREKGFKGIVAMRGNIALSLAHQFQPTAITLDVFLPDMLGWTVLNNLKHDPATRHIPVHIISVEEERSHALARGAFAYTVKPATTEVLDTCFDRIKKSAEPHTKRLLVIEDNEIERNSIVELLSGDDIEIATADTGAKAIEMLLDQPFDCCVLDLRLPDMSGFDLLDRLSDEPNLREIPVVVFTGKDLSPDEVERLQKVAKSILVKDVQSPERLFAETALFLHRVVADLPENKRKMLDRLHTSNDVLKGQKVLVVDDDARNIFALTTLLENQEMEVISTNNGRQAIEIIQQNSDIKVVLMDIMMPEMDGYQTMREIRKDPHSSYLPILALTAKAMKGDRDKCLAAGASDYIAKPVNTNELLTLLRVWLHR
jgi:CheY-like chemotaxis protein